MLHQSLPTSKDWAIISALTETPRLTADDGQLSSNSSIFSRRQVEEIVSTQMTCYLVSNFHSHKEQSGFKGFS